MNASNVARLDAPSGSELLGGRDAEALEILRDQLLAQAAEAREDLVRFCEFVGRTEHTREPIAVAPHQEVFLDFVVSHPRSVCMLPVGFSKTFSLALLTLFLLGTDPTTRGAIVSATEGQASKVVGMVRDYIESSLELRLVFPHLVRSRRVGDPWTQVELTVHRPPGIRDASLTAYGIGGAIAGARLNWIIADDLLNSENTNTKDSRLKVFDWFDLHVLSRLDPRSARVVVTNTPFHPDDVVHRLTRIGWATLRMDVEGGVLVLDDEERMAEGFAPYDHRLLVPASPTARGISNECRLDAYKHLPPRERTLWPARIDRKKLEQLRLSMLDFNFNRNFMCVVGDASSLCKREYIETCKARARERGVFRLLPQMPAAWRDVLPVFTGVDLAWSPGDKGNECALFTFCVHPDMRRQILDVDIGRYDPPTLLEKVAAKHRAYGSVLRIENVGGQAFFVEEATRSGIPVYPHNTSQSGKAHPHMGVASIFAEFKTGLWLIPNDPGGRCEPVVQRFVDDCLNYIPEKHTPDSLMASFFARAQAFEWGALTSGDTLTAAEQMAAQMALDIGVR